MIKSLFHRKKESSRLDERIVWGIWAPRKLQWAYKIMAADLRVPISVLVCHILRQWLADNAGTLLKNESERFKYGDYLARKYLTHRESEER